MGTARTFPYTCVWIPPTFAKIGFTIDDMRLILLLKDTLLDAIIFNSQARESCNAFVSAGNREAKSCIRAAALSSPQGFAPN